MKRHAVWDDKTRYFRMIVEEAKVLGWITDAEGYTLYSSPAWYEFTGDTSTEGNGLDWLDLVHPLDRVRVRKAYFTANDAGAEYGISYRLKTSTGNYQLVWGHGVPRRDSDGKFLGYLGMTQTMDEYSVQVGALTHADTALSVKPLSEREVEVMRLAAEGLSNSEIAGALDISCRTVEDHVRHSIQKLHASNRVHAVAKAIRLSAL